jgi:hypothetical protein
MMIAVSAIMALARLKPFLTAYDKDEMRPTCVLLSANMGWVLAILMPPD